MKPELPDPWPVLALCGIIAGMGSAPAQAPLELDALPGGLVLTEVMYNPVVPDGLDIADPDSLEFIEFQNASDQLLDFLGLILEGGLNVPLIVPELAPGQIMLFVRDFASFQQRYGSGLPVMAEFEGNLRNGGETLRFISLLDGNFFEFTYDDSAPWPDADGNGRSIELLNPSSKPDINNPANWIASEVDGGTPGVISPAVLPPSVLSFSPDRSHVAPGDPIVLNWETGRADAVAIDRGVGRRDELTGSTEIIAPPVPTVYSSRLLVPAGSIWRYEDNGIDQLDAWRKPGFNDSTWSSGAAKLGFGDGDEATVLANLRQPSVYFRHRFSVRSLVPDAALRLRVKFDDAAIVFINGKEAYRQNLPEQDIGFETFALQVQSDEDTWFSLTIPAAGKFLREGENVVAARVHNAASDRSDLGFDLDLAYAAEVDPVVNYTLTASNRAGASSQMASVSYADRSGADSENDRLPDTWERLHFGNLDRNADDDPDSDGFSNLTELESGTDPDDATSFPNLAIARVERTPGGLRFIVSGAAGRTVGVEYSGDLSPGSWIELGNAFEIDGQLSFTDPDPIRSGRGSGYYRAFGR